MADFLFNRDTPLWKDWEHPSMNGIHFNDKRLIQPDSELIHVYLLLSELCGQGQLLKDDFALLTTMTRFTNNKFNDFENSIWWPHKDPGYNGIVYFTEDENNGTNLYSPELESEEEWRLSRLIKEHEDPWRPKKRYKVLKHIEPRYNRMVLYNGKKFPHGMNICNNDYFKNTYRMNQVCFFKDSGRSLTK